MVGKYSERCRNSGRVFGGRNKWQVDPFRQAKIMLEGSRFGRQHFCGVPGMLREGEASLQILQQFASQQSTALERDTTTSERSRKRSMKRPECIQFAMDRSPLKHITTSRLGHNSRPDQAVDLDCQMRQLFAAKVNFISKTRFGGGRGPGCNHHNQPDLAHQRLTTTAACFLASTSLVVRLVVV